MATIWSLLGIETAYAMTMARSPARFWIVVTVCALLIIALVAVWAFGLKPDQALAVLGAAVFLAVGGSYLISWLGSRRVATGSAPGIASVSDPETLERGGEASSERPASAASGAWSAGSADAATPSAAAGTDAAGSVAALGFDEHIGDVVGLKERTESKGGVTEYVWNFRVVRFSPDGKQLPSVSVEMRGNGFEGGLVDGDRVRLPKVPPGGGTVTLSVLQNLTNGGEVRVKGAGFWGSFSNVVAKAGALLAILFFAAMIIGILAKLAEDAF